MEWMKNDRAEDQWSCVRPMSKEDWDRLRADGWRFNYSEMPEIQEEYDSSYMHPYYWFSVSAKHFITSPMRQGVSGTLDQMLEESNPPEDRG